MSTTTVRIPYPRRRWPLVAIGILVVGFLVLTFLSNFYVDVLWYREVGLSEVFWTRIWAQAGSPPRSSSRSSPCSSSTSP